MKGRIAEVFESIQGEGLYLGEKQIFVRFFGCNLKCRFCDTRLDRFIEYEPRELVDEIKLYHKDEYHSVSFTGGEPLLQKDFLKETLKLTSAAGYKNYLETNGTLAPELEEVIDYVDIVAMDLKLPTSANMGSFWGVHRNFLRVASQKEVFLKVVICQSTKASDVTEAVSLIRETNRSALLILQPNSYDDYKCLEVKLRDFREFSNREGITSCIIPQVHKIAGLR